MAASHSLVVSTPSAYLNPQGFYAKYLDTVGIQVLASERVESAALLASWEIINNLLSHTDNLRGMLAALEVRLTIIAEEEKVTELPEFQSYANFVIPDGRSFSDLRGVALRIDIFEDPLNWQRYQPIPFAAGEENILNYPTDPYRGQQSVLLHEAAHAITNALAVNYPGFANELKATYDNAIASGLWSNTYASTNFDEYWAELIQIWFHDNIGSSFPNGIINHINTRDELQGYDPGGYALIEKYLLASDWTPGKYFGNERGDLIEGNALGNYIVSRGGDDLIITGDGDDIVFAGDGPDDVLVGAGNKFVDGGAGFDTVHYTDLFDNHQVSFSGGIAEVTSIDGNTLYEDELVGVERLRFSDKLLDFNIEGNSGQAYRIYKAALDRQPDDAGLGYWIKDMENGASLTDVASSFIQSDEFAQLYGAQPSNDQFVTALYGNVLDRSPDIAGYNDWTGQLNSGASSREKVLTGFSESPENKANVIGLIGNGIVYEEWLG